MKRNSFSFWKALKDCAIGMKKVLADLCKQAVLQTTL